MRRANLCALPGSLRQPIVSTPSSCERLNETSDFPHKAPRCKNRPRRGIWRRGRADEEVASSLRNLSGKVSSGIAWCGQEFM